MTYTDQARQDALERWNVGYAREWDAGIHTALELQAVASGWAIDPAQLVADADVIAQWLATERARLAADTARDVPGSSRTNERHDDAPVVFRGVCHTLRRNYVLSLMRNGRPRLMMIVVNTASQRRPWVPCPSLLYPGRGASSCPVPLRIVLSRAVLPLPARVRLASRLPLLQGLTT